MAPPILRPVAVAVVGLLVLLDPVLVARAQSQPCLAADAALSGVVSEARRTHPNGTPIVALQLDLGRAACIAGAALDGGHLEARRVHLVPADAAGEAALRRALRRSVTVRGREIMEAHTAWHVGDAVLLDAVIAER